MKQRWTTTEMGNQKNKTFVITGATSGLGLADTKALYEKDATIIMAGRSAKKGQQVLNDIEKSVVTHTGKLLFIPVDLASLESIHHFVEVLSKTVSSIDVLINNAGVMEIPTRQLTVDGFEKQFGTDFLGPFALTGLMLPLLRKSKNPRIVTISSIAQKGGRINFQNLQSEKRYTPVSAYSQAKLADVIFAKELQRLSDENGWGLHSFAAHPGGARTNLSRGAGEHNFNRFFLDITHRFLMPAEKGALSTLFAATSDQAEDGNFYGPTGFLEMWGWPGIAKAPRAKDPTVARRLWSVSEQLTDVHYGKMFGGTKL
ncbi:MULTISPECIES: oxidoreductase [Furfurilactobacillus]|uniref:SDR family NAD(P)-dependent oxidoreductase n=1 Tax=Furfurilactobacillus rossiae TaxID=231049 RepID=A0A7C9IV95_9LACO|nr:oxidoreductase [Furfurilactobacillus milii]MYV05934.1 SDR family NAD(P)-dependent oxidoreductase [Furfurilactobacillus milii]